MHGCVEDKKVCNEADDVTKNECVQCTADNDYPYYEPDDGGCPAERPVCNNHKCVPCISDAAYMQLKKFDKGCDMQKPFCDEATGKCYGHTGS
jgi:hypothetical protein